MTLDILLDAMAAALFVALVVLMAIVPTVLDLDVAAEPGVTRHQGGGQRFGKSDVERVVRRQVVPQLPYPDQKGLVGVSLRWQVGQRSRASTASVGSTRPARARTTEAVSMLVRCGM